MYRYSKLLVKFYSPLNLCTEHKLTSPWVLVGTRADRVSDPVQYENTSTTIYETFHKNRLWFFPVDNTLGQKGSAVKCLMQSVETAINQAPYAHQHRPLGWFRALDKMKETKQTLIDAGRIAVNCDLRTQNELFQFLAFLHEMGVIMWR